MKVGVKAKLDGYKAIRKAIVHTEKRVKVGVLTDSVHKSVEDESDESEISMIELAAIHEFGSPEVNIPERSYLRATINGKREQVNEVIEDLLGKAVGKLLETPGGPSEAQAEAAAKRTLGLLGLKLVAMVRETIRNRETVGPEDQANKPATIARKKSTLPLVDTGQLINAITYAVVDKDEA